MVSILLASMDQRTGFSLRGFRPGKKTRSFQVLEQILSQWKMLLVSWKAVLFRLFPGGQTRQGGVECLAWLHCRHYFSLSFNICINCAIGVEITLKPSWQHGSSAQVSLTWQISWFEFSTALATRLLNLQWLLVLEFVGEGLRGR